jgi:hypothetical protein
MAIEGGPLEIRTDRELPVLAPERIATAQFLCDRREPERPRTPYRADEIGRPEAVVLDAPPGLHGSLRTPDSSLTSMPVIASRRPSPGEPSLMALDSGTAGFLGRQFEFRKMRSRMCAQLHPVGDGYRRSCSCHTQRPAPPTAESPRNKEIARYELALPGSWHCARNQQSRWERPRQRSAMDPNRWTVCISTSGRCVQPFGPLSSDKSACGRAD